MDGKSGLRELKRRCSSTADRTRLYTINTIESDRSAQLSQLQVEQPMATLIAAHKRVGESQRASAVEVITHAYRGDMLMI